MDQLATTCVFSTLDNELPRHNDTLKQVFADGIESTIKLLSKVSPGETDEERRINSIATFTQWVGALILTRAAGTGELYEEILEVSKKLSIRN